MLKGGGKGKEGNSTVRATETHDSRLATPPASQKETANMKMDEGRSTRDDDSLAATTAAPPDGSFPPPGDQMVRRRDGPKGP